MVFKRKHLLLTLAACAAVTTLPISSDLTTANADDASTELARTQILDTDQALESLATLFSYPFEGRTATTLYINRLPVLTFRDASDTADSDTEAIAATVSDKINELAENPDFDASELSVRWKSENKYELVYADEVVVAVDDTVTLADSTNNREQDALIAANRLRRLMGNAEPITEVVGKPKPKVVAPVVNVLRSFTGHASWYGPGFHGRLTANGERYNQYAMTAAHKTLPFGTKVRVTNMNNGRSVIVRINDRGPFIRGREIDLSKGSAQQIGLMASGVANVRLEILGK
ncbi:rare lipoprotein A [[Leptolyngbya] sp. PCC 7376]|uniref:septal ring lytic transglycosylase RlpA family protein n=1 Tax=[Leptolyngbya] sp. PCC 7376 TaxID=111781 RepID=UPI00029F0180|nr:septal ring lytic transglycosylase RlpA family protein [[Leptolyngbya] sp. PCC 7376]AFY36988.1 rare lipoprotein A [[Leptolyngbya] sp. PCC 7376]